MTPQELKNSILQLAIQGKLVEQRPEEGTGEELYRQIQTEKAKLIAEGKIKKEKPLPEITEDEVPFDIPESWNWVRLKDVVFSRGQETPVETFSYIDIGSIDNRRQCLNSVETLVEPENAPSRARKLVELGDIIYSTVRPYLHNTCIIDRTFSHKPIASTGFAVMTCYAGVFNRYLFYYLLSPAFDSYANNTENSKGVAYPAINDDRLYRAVISLPPLAEQKRIVAKIEELLPLIDRYEKAWSRLEEFNKRFPGDMQKSLLQLAIQGKLVEQRPEEGTAEELYRQIQAEKQALIREKLVKEEKELPAYDDPPFDIPDSWIWARITDCGVFVSGFTPKAEELCQCGVIPYFKVSDMNTVGNELWLTKTEQYLKDPNPKKFFLKNTIVYPKNGGAVFTNKKRILAQDSIVDLNTGGYTVIGPVDLQYIYLYFSLIDFRQCYKGTALPTIDMDKLKKRWLPLPPLAEQKRIVAKLEELLPLCEGLK